MSTLARELGFLARRSLAHILDHHSSTGIDWRGLVDKMGFSYEMNMLLSSKESPTLSLLEEWERVLGAQATLDTLIELLESLGCKEGVDLLMKTKTEKKIRINSKSSSCSPYNSSPLSNSPPENRTNSDYHSPLTPHNSLNVSGFHHTSTHLPPPPSSSSCSSSSCPSSSCGVDPHLLTQQMERISIGHSNSTEVHLQRTMDYIRSKQFDVFLSFSQMDEEFAEEIRSRLATQANMRVFVPSDDLMPGKVFSEQIADMIKRECRKTVVLLSPEYLKSEWCSYEARMALHESPDSKKHILIPILYKRCEVPRFLEHIYYLDYPRYQANPDSCQKFFWARLFKAVRFDPSKYR